MARLRNTAHWGNSSVIMLKPTDILDLGIKVGKDQIDIDKVTVIKGGMNGRNKKKK